MNSNNEYKNQLFYSYNNKQINQLNPPLGVLVGCVGTGKTTFFNKVTNQKQQTSDGLSSITRNSFSSNSAYGCNFKIIDTPGTQAEENKLNHALGIRSALIEGPINRIFLLVKFERVGAMQKNISELLFTLSEWKNLITIVITHWDKEDTEFNRQTFLQAKKNIQENDSDLQDSFIFVGKDSNPSHLCQAIYLSLCQNYPVKLEIDLTKFKYKFDIYNNITKYIMKQKEIFKIVQQNIEKDIISYNQDDKDEFLHACMVNISQIAEEIIQDLIKEHRKDMDEVQSYMHYMELKQHFTPIVERIRKLASQRMSYSLLNHSDPRNLFKRCPNCNLIWLKVEGCDGNTTCGNRYFGKDFFQTSKYFMRYIFDWRNLKWVKQQQNKSQQKDNYQKNDQGIGCGSTFNWGEAPIIGQEILQQLKDAGINDMMFDAMEEKQIQSFNFQIQYESQRSRVQYL
ncbi:signal recognition particle receptor beta subunit (macronuclear) [Tetrahymena thermophila SB210]|uniref:Signal recognition particle receptor beta subunit n=1 Tax=Tetrahymena thermophila (strain SB210) TaxID=312017 RepID=Q24FH2_TETTS|nr:signal recognition particle receptor beta subunit [Tetrahymena thermophila SB210]EAS06486.1 signal recognition particle receptor beta subunit [Tetrahymena thermophila SB210]|eukprot:XP_001026731.1 signal recognition particle receptor beta subunit [Tetrahymena thermophila SB210]